MGNINISFGGATITRTGAYSQVDSKNMVPIQYGASKIIAIIGAVPTGSTIDATKVNYFNNPATARSVINSSDLLDCMEIAWKHGADLIAVSCKKTASALITADVQAMVDLLANEFVDAIVPAFPDSSLLSIVDTHVTTMSSTLNRRERRAFYGHATGLAVSAVTALQTGLNSARGTMATPAVYYPDANGVLQLKPSTYLASAYAGLWASQPAQEPITFKYVKFDRLEKIYTGTEVNTLLAGNISPVEVVRNKGFRIVQGITLTSSADLTQNELSVATVRDDMIVGIRDFMEEKYIGDAGVAGIEQSMYNDLVTFLETYKRNGLIRGYIPESVTVTRNGTTFTLEYEAKPTLPVNNILVTAHLSI